MFSLLFCVIITERTTTTLTKMWWQLRLSYCSPEHCLVRHSGKCLEYRRLDGAGALFSSSFHYIEELQLLLVPKTDFLYAVFPWNSCSKTAWWDSRSCQRWNTWSIWPSEHHPIQQEANSVPYARGCKYWCQLWDLDWLGPKKDDARFSNGSRGTFDGPCSEVGNWPSLSDHDWGDWVSVQTSFH